MAERSFAIHITWTCYGTWLPGDERGYVSNTRLPEGGFEPKQNTAGTPYTRDDPLTRHTARSEQSHPTVWLTSELATCVAESLVNLAKPRSWRILQAAVMANHVHVVVMNCPDDGPTVRRVLKGVTQAALSKLNGRPRRWWTEDGSNRYKKDHAAIDAAVDYVSKQEGMLAGVKEMRAFVVERDGVRFLDEAQ